jgi:CheY-like chemotaxis protein
MAKKTVQKASGAAGGRTLGPQRRSPVGNPDASNVIRGRRDRDVTAPLILIADDDPLIQAIVDLKLRAAGYRTATESDGAAVLAEARMLRPDLIVLDALMPGTDGFEVLRRLRQDPSLAAVKVVMLTALRRDEDQAEARRLGAAAYFVKPFDPDQLIECVVRLAPPPSARRASC